MVPSEGRTARSAADSISGMAMDIALRVAPVVFQVVRQVGYGEMARCEACDQIIVAGGTFFFEQRFCSPYCVRAYHCLEGGGFCEGCLARTDDKSPGNTRRVNGIGTVLWRDGELCPTCLSVPMRKWFTFVLIPILPLRRYLVAWTGPEQYVGRRVVR